MPEWAIVALVMFGSVALYLGANTLAFRFSAWYALSKVYAHPQSRPDQPARGLSGKAGSTFYNGSLIVGVDPGGLYLATVVPLNLWARPLYIPWSELHFERRWKFLWTRKICYRTATGTPIELHGRAVDMVGWYAP